MKEICWLLLAVSGNGELGDELTPVGSPPMVTLMLPLKPFMGVAVTVTEPLVVVCATSRELGEAESEKLGGGGGLEPPPPQPALTNRRRYVNALVRRDVARMGPRSGNALP